MVEVEFGDARPASPPETVRISNPIPDPAGRLDSGTSNGYDPGERRRSRPNDPPSLRKDGGSQPTDIARHFSDQALIEKAMAYHIYHGPVPGIFVSADTPVFKKKLMELGNGLERVTAMGDGTRKVSAEEVPDLLVLSRKREKLPDGFSTINGLLVISDTAKNLLEKMDPAAHQYFPIQIQRGPAFQYWAINIHVHQSSIIPEKSDVRMLERSDPDNPVMMLNGDWKTITHASEKLGRYNLWRETYYPGELFCSESLRKELRARKLRFFKLRPTIEI